MVGGDPPRLPGIQATVIPAQNVPPGSFFGWVGELVSQHALGLGERLVSLGTPRNHLFGRLEGAFSSFVARPGAFALAAQPREVERLLAELAERPSALSPLPEVSPGAGEPGEPRDRRALGDAAEALLERVGAHRALLGTCGPEQLQRLERAVVSLRLLEHDALAALLDLHPAQIAALSDRARAELGRFLAAGELGLPLARRPGVVDALLPGSFDEQVLGAEGAVLVHFSASWCQPCRAIEPALLDLSADFGAVLRVVELDVDTHPELPDRYRVRALPTLVLFRGGQPAARMVGAASPRRLHAWIEGLLGPGAA